MKRKNSVLNKSNKKLKLDIFVSGSSVRNYFLNDPLLDWLNLYNKNNVDDPFTNYIMEQGNIFELEIYNKLKLKFESIQIAKSSTDRSIELFDKTVNCMKNGIPIIYQGVLYNYKNNTFGSPDLLIRSDYINRIFNYNVILKEEEKIISPNINKPYYYLVIDIKWSQINLDSSGIHVLNSDSLPAYKGQILIYTLALSEILGIEINKAFILGKSNIWYKNNIKYTNDNKLGLIDYKNMEYNKIYYDKLQLAIKWVQDVKKYGNNWKLLPIPTHQELYPNMNNYKDGKWRKYKIELSNKIKEITAIWNVSVKHRNIAHSKNIFSWDNINCNSTNLNINGLNAKKIDLILNINRSTDIINTNNYKINNLPDVLKIFLDYETISNNFIFMIGIGYENRKNWNYKCFITNNKTLESETKMFNDFWNYINFLLNKFNKKKVVFIHWTQAEPCCYKNIQNQIPTLQNKLFIDLYKIFIDNSIVVNGALNYSLKSIAKAMYNHKLIKSTWNYNSKCCNGLTALLLAIDIYKNNNNVTLQNNLLKEISYYNEIDCKVLYEIYNYLT